VHEGWGIPPFAVETYTLKGSDYSASRPDFFTPRKKFQVFMKCESVRALNCLEGRRFLLYSG